MGVKPVWVEDIEGAPDGYMLTGQAAQDYADGVALRRLREALPSGEDDRVTVILSIDYGDTEASWWQVDVESAASVFETEGRARPEEIWYEHTGFGATIAEAADKCREALS